MTTDAGVRPWTESGYGDISTAERFGDQVEVGFANGDVVRLAPSLFGVHGDFSVNLAPDDDGLAIQLASSETERTVSWSQLRAATDPEYAQEMRRQDAKESRRLGRRLRALREDRGLNQKDLAHLVGMSGPQLSKIENGASDLRFSTVQSLLRAMGATLEDISGPGALEISQRAIRKQLEVQGVGRELLDRLLKIAPRSAVPRLLKRAFGWDVDALASGELLPVSSFGLVFKSTRSATPPDSPLVALARTVSEVIHDQAELVPFEAPPTDPADVRTALLHHDGDVNLSSLTDWMWASGIPVIPVHGRGGFCAAAWSFQGSPVVVVKESRELAVYWLFDLAHELGHVARGHLDDAGVVDVDDLRPLPRTAEGGGDPQEVEANDYALRLLLGDYEELVDEVRRGSRGNYLRFKGAVTTVARKAEVNPGLLGLVAAHELTDIGEPKDRWGSATNLSRADGDGRPVVIRLLLSRVDLSDLSEVDSMLVAAVVTD